MKPNQGSECNDEQLSSVLRGWVVERSLPPGFQEQVWRRIERAEVRPRPSIWATVSGWLDTALPRPRVALSYIAALLLLGVAAGSLSAQVKNSKLNAALSERYVQSIDPYYSDLPRP